MANTPFTLTWSEGKCVGCKIAVRLGEIQFVSRSEVWGVGSEDHLGGVNVVVVHSTDAGRTWREVPKSQQYTDPDAQLAFWFLDVRRGWIAAGGAGDPELIGTQDGGRHWRSLSQESLQNMQFTDESHGYGTVAGEFVRTDDGGRSWVKTKIPDIGFIDRMVFLTADNGWIAGTTGMNGKDLLVFRTVNGGRDWEESRTTPPQPPERIRDLFFRINSEAGSPSGITSVRAPICIPRLTEESIGRRILIYRFKGRVIRQTWYDLLPEKEASSFSWKATDKAALHTRRMGGHIGRSRLFQGSSMIARSSQAMSCAVSRDSAC